MATENLFDPLYQSIFPVVYYEENNFAHIAGTSILIENNDIPYIMTAAHILRDIGSKHPLYLLLTEKAVLLPGPAFMSKLPDKTNHLDIDIAVFPLIHQPELWDHLLGYKTISLMEFDNSISYTRSHYYIFGYPWRKSKYLRDSKEMHSKPLSYFTDYVTDDSLYQKYSRTKNTHILVQYIQTNTKNTLGESIIAPMPHGISGGPLFKALIDEHDQVIALIFEGLLTDWKDKKVIIATKKNQIKSFIEANLALKPIAALWAAPA